MVGTYIFRFDWSLRGIISFVNSCDEVNSCRIILYMYKRVFSFFCVFFVSSSSSSPSSISSSSFVSSPLPSLFPPSLSFSSNSTTPSFWSSPSRSSSFLPSVPFSSSISSLLASFFYDVFFFPFVFAYFKFLVFVLFCSCFIFFVFSSFWIHVDHH